MQKVFLIAIIYLFICSNNSNGQTSINVQMIGMGGVSSFTTSSSKGVKQYEIKGSPYYNRDFMFGNVELSDSIKFSGLLRYNLFTQEMEFVYKRDTLVIDNPIKVKYINFAGKKFTYSVIVQNFWRKNLIYGGYFEVLNEGNCQLLIKYQMDYRLNRFVPYYAGGGGDGSYRYIPSVYYYMRYNTDEPAIKLERSKRFLIKSFPQYKNEISDFIKKNKVNLNKKKDLIKVFDYINLLRNEKNTTANNP